MSCNLIRTLGAPKYYSLKILAQWSRQNKMTSEALNITERILDIQRGMYLERGIYPNNYPSRKARHIHTEKAIKGSNPQERETKSMYNQ